MRALIAVLFLLTSLSATAVPVITKVERMQGFVYGGTKVTIHGSGFSGGAVQVYFDTVPAIVTDSTPTRLEVVAYATVTGLPIDRRTVNVIVRVSGQGEAVHPGFEFSPYAEPAPENYQPVLVPLATRTFQGANGSIWTSELRVFNAGPVVLRMPGPTRGSAEGPLDPAIVVQSGRTERVTVPALPGAEGAFLYVPLPLWSAAKFSLRVRDLAHNAASLGASVPVFSEADAGDALSLIHIPTDPRYRATLRIYGWGEGPMKVFVTVYPERGGDTPIDRYEVDLRGVEHIVADPFPPYPAYAAIDPLTPAVRGSGEHVRIALSNGDHVDLPGPGYGKFVALLSLTNNVTQQVTIVPAK